MDTFIQKYQPHVKGVLSGFDRLVFRGNLMGLCTVDGMMRYLSHVSVLLKHFSEHAKRATLWLRQGSIAEALRLGRPVQYLRSSQASKEGFARDIAQRDGIRDGLIAVLTCVEPIWSYRVHRDPIRKRLVLRPEMRKGLQFYHYWMHPHFGFMHGRIATWFPFQIQVCINGREWLARRMDRAGLAYLRRDNSFPWIEDVPEAQRMMDEMQRVAWVEMLQGIARCLNPAHEEMFRAFPIDYYWTAHQSEWATDLMFDERASIEAMYPLLTRGTMEAFNAEQVMRFLGHKPSANFLGEAYTDHRRRKEGVRVKHQMKANSVKVYDKGAFEAVGGIRINPMCCVDCGYLGFLRQVWASHFREVPCVRMPQEKWGSRPGLRDPPVSASAGRLSPQPQPTDAPSRRSGPGGGPPTGPRDPAVCRSPPSRPHRAVAGHRWL